MMPDRKKIIKGLDVCMNSRKECEGCTYIATPYCKTSLIADVNALLKEQEAKWVEDKQDEHCRLIKCSNCGLTFIVGNNIPYDEWIEDRNYCRRCGARMVKWDA